jgi:hypothetical protein
MAKAFPLTPVSGVGDAAFYLALGDNVGLIVKKGSGAFKVAVYQHGPVDKKQAAEKVLAGYVLAKF